MSTTKSNTSSGSTAGEKKPARKKKPDHAITSSAEQRYRMIEEAAYLKAEKAGFRGDSMQYWLAAEKEIKEKFPG